MPRRKVSAEQQPAIRAKPPIARGDKLEKGWVLLVYRVPSEPTRHRVQIWRKVKATGALFLQNSVCILPNDRRHEQEFRRLRQYIVDKCGGQAYVFRCEYIGPPGVLEPVFNRWRDEEYAEIIHRCKEFLQEMDEETKSAHFTFAELEENEEDLAKLASWYEKVKMRDFFDASLGPKAEKLLAACRDSLGAFSDRVFAVDDGQTHLVPNEAGRAESAQERVGPEKS